MKNTNEYCHNLYLLISTLRGLIVTNMNILRHLWASEWTHEWIAIIMNIMNFGYLYEQFIWTEKFIMNK